MQHSEPATTPFVITNPLPDPLAASKLQVGDTFAFPEDPTPLTVLSARADSHFNGFLLLRVDGSDLPLCIRETEDVRPLRMPRTFHLPCVLCGEVTRSDLDLATNGEPRLLVCARH
ncbi:hypothetical protein [Streptomyces olivoreticuli]|uniref:hypothetical protein n=1 Tax=Streptomyces olivoreticuli TaxID=68246 RepID=UPI000E26CBFD|nr:hypothetical protein [Streptomyces olivoreticuli]